MQRSIVNDKERWPKSDQYFAVAKDYIAARSAPMSAVARAPQINLDPPVVQNRENRTRDQ